MDGFDEIDDLWTHEEFEWPTQLEDEFSLPVPEPRLIYDNLKGISRFTFGLDDIDKVVEGMMKGEKQATVAAGMDMKQSTLSQKLSGKRALTLTDLNSLLGALGYTLKLVATRAEDDCECAYTEAGCTCKTFDSSNGGTQ